MANAQYGQNQALHTLLRARDGARFQSCSILSLTLGFSHSQAGPFAWGSSPELGLSSWVVLSTVWDLAWVPPGLLQLLDTLDRASQASCDPRMPNDSSRLLRHPPVGQCKPPKGAINDSR